MTQSYSPGYGYSEKFPRPDDAPATTDDDQDLEDPDRDPNA